MKKKVCAVLLGTALTCHVPLVYGAVQDYQAVTEADKEDNKIFQAFSTEDGSGNSVNVAACWIFHWNSIHRCLPWHVLLDGVRIEWKS